MPCQPQEQWKEPHTEEMFNTHHSIQILLAPTSHSQTSRIRQGATLAQQAYRAYIKNQRPIHLTLHRHSGGPPGATVSIRAQSPPTPNCTHSSFYKIAEHDPCVLIEVKHTVAGSGHMRMQGHPETSGQPSVLCHCVTESTGVGRGMRQGIYYPTGRVSWGADVPYAHIRHFGERTGLLEPC